MIRGNYYAGIFTGDHYMLVSISDRIFGTCPCVYLDEVYDKYCNYYNVNS